VLSLADIAMKMMSEVMRPFRVETTVPEPDMLGKPIMLSVVEQELPVVQPESMILKKKKHQESLPS
jgi:hypothetical protein